MEPVRVQQRLLPAIADPGDFKGWHHTGATFIKAYQSGRLKWIPSIPHVLLTWRGRKPWDQPCVLRGHIEQVTSDFGRRGQPVQWYQWWWRCLHTKWPYLSFLLLFEWPQLGGGRRESWGRESHSPNQQDEVSGVRRGVEFPVVSKTQAWSDPSWGFPQKWARAGESPSWCRIRACFQ